MGSDQSFDGVYDTIRKNFLFIAIIGVIGAAAGAAYSYTLTPRFESTAYVYPINLHPYSDESETEQMMQLFDFIEIREAVIDKFKLYDRDGLTPGAPEYWYYVNLLYDDRVSISPTRYESIRINCEDEDPEVAKEMVEEIIEQFNIKHQSITERKHSDYLALKEGELSRLNGVMDSLRSRIISLREGTVILDIEGQSEGMTQGYLRLLEKGVSGSRLRELEELMDEIGTKGTEVRIIEEMLIALGEYYATLTREYNAELSKKDDDLTYVHVVVEPRAADKKSYPVRWIIVLISGIGALLSALIFFGARTRFS